MQEVTHHIRILAVVVVVMAAKSGIGGDGEKWWWLIGGGVGGRNCEGFNKLLQVSKQEASNKQETIIRKIRQARVGKQVSASKKQEGERKQVEKGDEQQERNERSRKQEKFSKNFKQVDPVIGGVLRGGRSVKDGVSDQACSGDHKKASGKNCSFVCKNEQPALLNEVINLWLSVEVYRVKLWKDIQNAHEHYMAKLNQVLDPLLTTKYAPEQVKVPVQLLLIFAKLFPSSKKTEPKNVSLNQLIALDDVIDMGRRLDAFTKSVKVGGAGKKPIIVSRLIKIIIEYWMVNLKWDLKQISIEKWTIKLIDGVGKSATRSLKNTTNGREKGL
ncbi:hypothetical protein Tco_0732956 [Tanacetum coccineum]